MSGTPWNSPVYRVELWSAPDNGPKIGDIAYKQGSTYHNEATIERCIKWVKQMHSEKDKHKRIMQEYL